MTRAAISGIGVTSPIGNSYDALAEAFSAAVRGFVWWACLIDLLLVVSLWFSLPRWIGAGLATAAAALALVIGLQLVPPSGSGAVRWLDSRGNPVVVLQDDHDATIIWLLEAPAEVSGRTGSAVS